MYSTSQEMLEQKWRCEVGGIIWWLGNPDFKWTEGQYVVRNVGKVMWPGDLGEISVSLQLSKYVELQLCSNKQSVSPVKHNNYSSIISTTCFA
jgi:hypothetical protein